MPSLEHLTGIPPEKRNKVISCLDELLTFRDASGKLSPVISGYNWYASIVKGNRAVTLSNIHETENYKQGMVQDIVSLGFNQRIVLQCIRAKDFRKTRRKSYESTVARCVYFTGSYLR